MSVRQPTNGPVTSPPTCTPPGATMPWPIGGSVTCQPASPDRFRRQNGHTLAVTITFSLTKGLEFNEDAPLALLYIVNGSLDYSALFAQTEISRNSMVTIPKGQTQASITVLTLPIPPNSTFELEVLAYPTGAKTIISGPVQTQEEAAGEEAAEDKSLKALNVLATTALVTALGALAFALLRRTKD